MCGKEGKARGQVSHSRLIWSITLTTYVGDDTLSGDRLSSLYASLHGPHYGSPLGSPHCSPYCSPLSSLLSSFHGSPNASHPGSPRGTSFGYPQGSCGSPFYSPQADTHSFCGETDDLDWLEQPGVTEEAGSRGSSTGNRFQHIVQQLVLKEKYK